MDQKIEQFLEKILPVIRQKNNSEDTVKLWLEFELKKFYNNAFADGQMNVLEGQKK